MKTQLLKLSGYSLIELTVVIVLLALLAGFASLGILRSVDIYVHSSRNYLEIFQEGKIALEKMIRELRETNPDGVTIGSGSVSFTKGTDHATPEDTSLSVTFQKTGTTIERSTSTGTFTLLDDVTAFTPSRDAGTGVVTIDFTISRGDNTIHLKSATWPRLPDS